MHLVGQRPIISLYWLQIQDPQSFLLFPLINASIPKKQDFFSKAKHMLFQIGSSNVGRIHNLCPLEFFSVFELKNNTKFQGEKVMDILLNTIQYIFQ